MDQADGTYWSYSYGGRGRLTGAIRRSASNQIVEGVVYTYDAAANLTQSAKQNTSLDGRRGLNAETRRPQKSAEEGNARE